MTTHKFFDDEISSNNIGVAMAGGGGSQGRRENDFYPTEPEATIALLEVIQEDLERLQLSIHEPSCGDGAISRILEERGFEVYSTDLIDRGYGIAGLDYLECKETRPIVITNPPFCLAEQFIRKALDDGAERVYMLLKSTFFHARSRLYLLEQYPLARVMPLTWRLDFTGQGRPTMECSWFEWRKGYTGLPQYSPALRRPEGLKLNSERCEKTVDMFG